MKYALVALVLVLAFFIWRHKRRQRLREREQHQAAQAQAAARKQQEQTLAAPVQMVQCHHCGLHLPLSEATPGALGHYCDHEHRQRVEG
ncbi:flagellar biosynthesis/type III secretory pathway lipoprotein [Serpentinimonas maccroryi]|jgi:uncharacterized protein|uniref:Flagellar biosynthesis/type III secretory pathway lipoprotein n=1 Tax=Serpentinimonas maccroryi TaxID=1458426 RepID=A0A060NXR5_9BURK|nr:PP0621 family protein [Serpentinimonas maccroryi]MCM2478549.1 hypothetical protein [Serpentinimonas maccroryi]BAO83694.1 flagellar biosynthesis/type III secretory pathway lipoprotein [Serpentinimonas maccroryi]